MSIFQNFINKITHDDDYLSDAPVDKNYIKDPVYMKEFKESNLELDNLKNIVDKVSDDDRKEIEKKIKCLVYGLSGESSVNYELKNSRLPIVILHNLYLEYRGYSSQIDFVVISYKFILVIECKNMVGNITVTSSGDFVRNYKNRKELIYSPFTQNEKHVNIIEDILDNENIIKRKYFNMIKSIIVAANDKSFINTKYAPANIKESIVRCDKLIDKMNDFMKSDKVYHTLSYEEVIIIANTLLKYNSEHVSTDFSKYKIVEKESMKEKDVDDIYQKLKNYRKEQSLKNNIKAYCVFTNSEIEEIVQKMPKSIDELAQIHGFAKVKCEKYGHDILEIVNN